MRVVVASAAGAGAILLHHYFEDILRGHPSGKLGLTVISLAALLTLAELGIEKLKSLKSVRKHIIFREDWIEGVWFDFLLDSEAKEVRGYGVITIHFASGELKIHGSGMSPNGVKIAPFVSTLVDWNDGRLRFLYKKEGGRTIGTAEYNFLRFGPGALRDYNGWFLETEGCEVQNVRAFLITDKKIPPILEDPIRRHAAIEQLVNEYKPLAVAELDPPPT